ncbi:MAG: tRNA (adenosine(37)-N6)-threonylcarbamoyltransferase complex transferase subunit TsaD [Firmicutes bacterium]|nr:tRNA (adenosine(37)-N6)-threonylcarbamoyltransferase complex transferase subunit TsaD [Bacillota bacterium]
MYTSNTKEKFDKLIGRDNITILGIETSCDETAVSIVRNGTTVLSDILFSQIDTHSIFGGVVPEIASRAHAEKILPLIDSALKDAKLTFNDIDAIAVTYAPGLVGALLVGVSVAKSLSFAYNIPLIKVNHIEGHICANFLGANSNLVPPFCAVVVSGGHTAIYNVKDYVTYEYLGGTTDDAIGEAFDKVARFLNLPYPGGPQIDKLAQSGQANINFFKNQKSISSEFKLSYSGLKTAVINYIHGMRQRGEDINLPDLCASFTATACDLLIDTVVAAAKKHKLKTIALAGGVAANTYLRTNLPIVASKQNISVVIPPHKYCTDNAAMIASRAYFAIKKGQDIAGLDLNAGIV